MKRLFAFLVPAAIAVMALTALAGPPSSLTALRSTVSSGSVTTVTLNAACSELVVIVPATASYGALVSVPGIHASGDGIPIYPGMGIKFRHPGITVFYASGDGGSSTVAYGPSALGILNE